MDIKAIRFLTNNVCDYPSKTIDLRLYECKYLSGEFHLHDHSEYLFVDKNEIINYLLHHNEINIDKIVGYNSRVTNETINNAIQFLTNKEVLVNNQLSVDNISNIKDYLEDLINYGINRYEMEFGYFEGKYKLYANYSK